MGMAVSDLVSLISDKKKATEAGDTDKVEKLNADYPILRSMDLYSDKKILKLEKHFKQHPLQSLR